MSRSLAKTLSAITAAILILLAAAPVPVEAVRRGNYYGDLMLVSETLNDSGGFERAYLLLSDGERTRRVYISLGPEFSSVLKTITEAKQHIIDTGNEHLLRLPPGTIVPEWIWQQWDAEGYTPVHEFELADKFTGPFLKPEDWHPTIDRAKVLGSGAAAKPAPFSDIAGHWAQEAIERMVAAGVIKGYPDGTFRPDNTVTRAEFIAMVRRIKAANTMGGSTGFRDIAQHWARDDIQALEAEAWLLASQHPDNMLYPDIGMPRQEMARLIARAASLQLVQGHASFADNDVIPDEFRPFINAAFAANLIQGYPDGTFRPTGTLTRAEAATMLVRLLDLT